jgi:hypothetical protein
LRAFVKVLTPAQRNSLQVVLPLVVSLDRIMEKQDRKSFNLITGMSPADRRHLMNLMLKRPRDDEEEVEPRATKIARTEAESVDLPSVDVHNDRPLLVIKRTLPPGIAISLRFPANHSGDIDPYVDVIEALDAETKRFVTKRLSYINTPEWEKKQEEMFLVCRALRDLIRADGACFIGS